jgi:hypothetical protein
LNAFEILTFLNFFYLHFILNFVAPLRLPLSQIVAFWLLLARKWQVLLELVPPFSTHWLRLENYSHLIRMAGCCFGWNLFAYFIISFNLFIVKLAIKQANINVRAIAQGCSEYNITVVIKREDSIKALRAVHSRFYLSRTTIAMGIIGPGLIGSTLLDQLRDQVQFPHTISFHFGSAPVCFDVYLSFTILCAESVTLFSIIQNCT